MCVHFVLNRQDMNLFLIIQRNLAQFVLDLLGQTLALAEFNLKSTKFSDAFFPLDREAFGLVEQEQKMGYDWESGRELDRRAEVLLARGKLQEP